MNIRRVGVWALVGLAAWWLVTQPEHAANTVRGVFGIVALAAVGATDFLTALSP